MKKIIYVAFAFVTALSFYNSGHAEEGNDGGGGYAYYYNVIPIIKANIQELSSLLSGIEQKDLNEVLAKHSNGQARPIDKNALAQVINSTILSPAILRTKPNPEGTMDLLIMDYHSKNRTIEALQPFFQMFGPQIYQIKRIDKVEEFNRILIHEALHIFGYGLQDDHEAFNVSLDILPLIQNGILNCGTDGNLKEREAHCALLYNDKYPNKIVGYPRLVTRKYTNPSKPYSPQNSTYSVYRLHDYYIISGDLILWETEKDEESKELIRHACDRLPTLGNQVSWRVPTFNEAMELVNYNKEVDPEMTNPNNPHRFGLFINNIWSDDFRAINFRFPDFKTQDPRQGYAREKKWKFTDNFAHLKSFISVLCVSK